MLHRPDRARTHPKALCEDGHRVVTRKAQSLQTDPELGQALLLIINI